MADVRIIDLPAGLPSAASQIAIDLSETQKATVSQIGDAARPFASQSEAESGVDNTKTMTPLAVAQQLAAKGPTLFASVSEGLLASTALQPADVKALAFKDKASVADIDASGTPTSTTFLAGNGVWTFLPGGGNMLSSIYDPGNVGGAMAFAATSATAAQGSKADTALQPVTGLYRVSTIDGASSANIPANVSRLSTEDRRMFMARRSSEPVGPLKFQNGTQWWGSDEIIIDATMAGCKGDGSTNDTAALNALCYAGFPIYLGGQDRTYLVDFLDWRDRTKIVPLYAHGTTIKKRVDDGNPLFQINTLDAGGASLIGPNTIEGITFDADGKADTAVLTANLARWQFTNRCRFINARQDGFLSYGGISVLLTTPDAIGNGRSGIRFDKYTYGYPNANAIVAGGIFNNGKTGIYFDGGRNLTILDCDIEGNGTAGDATSAGIWVGNNIGTEAGTTIKPGILVQGGWLEGNKGATVGGAGNQSGAIRLGSGFNRIDRIYTVANGTYCDVLADGGTYDISSSAFDGARTHVVDTAGTGFGNVIRWSTIGGTHAIDPLKTSVIGFANTWATYTPTLTADAGTIGSTSYALGRYQVIGRNVMVNLSVGIGTAGTAIGDLMISLPFAAKLNTSVAGVYNNGGLTGVAPTNQYYVRVRKATDGTTIIANSRDVTVSFTYEMA